LVVFVHRNYVIPLPTLEDHVFTLFRPIQLLYGLVQAKSGMKE